LGETTESFLSPRAVEGAVANLSLNASLNATNATLLDKASDVASVAQSFLPLVLSRMWDLVAAPFRNQEMLWIIFPLLLTFIVLEFYFDRHGDEELGWAAAVANSLILLIVALDLLKHGFHQATPWAVLREIALAIFTDSTLPLEPQVLLLILFVGALGVAITLINYYHLLPRKLAFEVSGHPPMNYLAYFAIVIVYSTGTTHEIPLDLATLIAGALLYVMLLVLFFFARRFVRNAFGGSGGRGGSWGR
jgi:hypothetical protein